MNAATLTRQIAVTGGVITTSSVGSGSPVLLIHGTAPPAWGVLPGLLAAEHEVITYDRRCFGGSASLAPAGLSGHATDTTAILRALHTPATLVGWSIGGVIAIEVAVTAPDLISGMVLLEPPFHLKRHPRPRMISAIAGATLLGKTGHPTSGARRFLRWALGRRDGSTDYNSMPREWHARLAATDGPAVVQELAAGTGEHLTPGQLGDISTPVLILSGGQSQLAFGAAARRVASAIPGAEHLELADSAHAIQLDAPAAVAASVAALKDR